MAIFNFKLFLVSAQTCCGTGSFASLEMSLVNILTALEVHLTTLENDTTEGHDKHINDCDSAHEDFGVPKFLSQLVSLSNCDAKNVALYKLQNCHIK